MPKPIAPAARKAALDAQRETKMARSLNRYVRGSTAGFYRWLEQAERVELPEGPQIWICGDCHLGNIGPLSDADGRVSIQIRDLDQTVIGNPANDILRLGLSLAAAASGSNLPGIVTARMLEALIRGYETAFEATRGGKAVLPLPKSVETAMKRSRLADWSSLAGDHLEDPRPSIPIGKRYWPLSPEERQAVEELFAGGRLQELVTRLGHRDDHAKVKLTDAAYWMKGCSSLGLLRLAILLTVRNKGAEDYCIIDVKQAVEAIAPQEIAARMPADNAERVVEGARHLAPALGNRMIATHFLGKSVFIRELLPQDLKLEIDTLSRRQASKAAEFLGAVVGRAHARQLSKEQRRDWLATLQKYRPATIDAPTWLWAGTVDLLAQHQRAYLEHCRRVV